METRAPPTPLHVAFKEWASVLLALERGAQDVLFRKGGIAEDAGGFRIEHRAFALFPTYFHQQGEALRSEHRGLWEEARAARRDAGRVRLSTWVEVLSHRELSTQDELAALQARHVYAPHVLAERMASPHGRALHVIEVRVHALPAPFELTLRPEHGGCRSWVALPAEAGAGFC